MAFGVEEAISRAVLSRDALGNAYFKSHRLGLRQFTRRVFAIKQQRRKIKKQLQEGITPTQDYIDLADLIVYRYGADRRYFSETVLYDLEDYLYEDINLCEDYAEESVCCSQKLFRLFFGMSKHHLFNAQILLEKAVHDMHHMRSFGFVDEAIFRGKLSYLFGKQRKVRLIIECPQNYGDIEIFERRRRDAERRGDYSVVSALDRGIDVRLETEAFSDYLDKKLL